MGTRNFSMGSDAVADTKTNKFMLSLSIHLYTTLQISGIADGLQA